MQKTLTRCTICHAGHWLGDECPYCKRHVKAEKPLPKIDNLLERLVERLGDIPQKELIAKLLRDGYSPHYIKQLVGAGYTRLLRSIVHEFNLD